MELGFSEEQDILRRSVRDFMENEAPTKHVREMEEDLLGYSPQLWRKVAQLGWVGLDYPEQYGGSEGTLVDVAVVCEEMGKSLFPSPYLGSAVLAGHTVLAAGNDKQKGDILPKVSSGEMVLSFALTEPSATYESSGVETTAIAADNGYVLNGVKLFVPFAHAADLLVVVTRTGSSSTEDGISLFLVDPKAAGVSVNPLRVISGEKQSEVVLNQVKVGRDTLLGELNKGWPVVQTVLDRGKVALSAEMVGGAQQALDMAVTYSKERQQFGVPIGSFQAIQHRLADLATELVAAKWIIYKAAWLIAGGEDASEAASRAKAFISDLYRRAVVESTHTHGGYGFMKEYDIQLYFRRAKATEVVLGTQEYNLELVAQRMGL